MRNLHAADASRNVLGGASVLSSDIQPALTKIMSLLDAYSVTYGVEPPPLLIGTQLLARPMTLFNPNVTLSLSPTTLALGGSLRGAAKHGVLDRDELNAEIVVRNGCVTMTAPDVFLMRAESDSSSLQLCAISDVQLTHTERSARRLDWSSDHCARRRV